MDDIIELGFMLLIIVLVIAGVQWFLLRFTHWSVVLIATAIIALFISSFYVALSHATPNGGSNGPDISEFITPMIVVFVSLLCGLALVSYLTHIQIPRKAFLLPLVIIVVFAVGRYSYEYVHDVSFFSKEFSSCKITFEDKSGGKSIVNEISFYNPSSCISSSVETNLEAVQNQMLVRNASKIIFQCYTEVHGMSRQDFSFDYSLCKEKDGAILGFCFWLREKVVLPMKIIVQPNNKVDLYIDNRLTKQYQLNSSDLETPILEK